MMKKLECSLCKKTKNINKMVYVYTNINEKLLDVHFDLCKKCFKKKYGISFKTYQMQGHI